jgi:hypothetical protein
MENFRRKKNLAAFVFLIVFAAGVAVVMLLWNALLPAIFGVTCINYWQAAGLIVLTRILFGGFGHLKHAGMLFAGHEFRGRKPGDAFEWHDKMRGMSHDERREFIRKRMFGTDKDESK